MALESELQRQEHVGRDAIAVAKACAREVYVFGDGVIGGALDEGFDEFSNSKSHTFKQLAAAAGIGIVLGRLQSAGTAGKLVGESALAGGTLAFAADVWNSPRWAQIKDIASDTWHNPENLNGDLAAARQTLGRVAFDTTVNAAGTFLGAGASGYFGVSRATHNGIKEFTGKGFLPPGEHKATWGEFVERYNFSPRRTELLTGLESTLRDLKELGCEKVYIGGSFVSKKPVPNDVDGIWVTAGTKDAATEKARWTWYRENESQFFKDTERLWAGKRGEEFFKYNQRTRQHVGVVSIDLTKMPELRTFTPPVEVETESFQPNQHAPLMVAARTAIDKL